MTGPKPLVLVVEDDATLRFLVQKQLQHMSIEAAFASDGMEAVELAKQTRFDLILMDVMMPRLDGCSAAREIRRYQAEQQQVRTPIIVMTAYLDRKKCIGDDIDDYLFKPVMYDKLKATIDRWLIGDGAA